MKSSPSFLPILQDQLSDYVTAIAWASETRLFAISAAGELVQWQQAQPHWKRTDLKLEGAQFASGELMALSALGISADGTLLSVAGQSGTLIVWDISLEQPKLLTSLTFPSIWLDQLAWHPSESVLAFVVGSKVHIWDCLNNIQLRTLDFEASTVLNLDWHPLGRLIAVGGHGGVKIWDIQTEAEPELLEVPGASLSTKWSEDGTYLASGNLDRTLSVLDYEQPPPWLMQGFPSKVRCIAWKKSLAQECLLAAVASDGISIWRRDPSSQWNSSVLTGHTALIQDIAFQPKGHILASGGNDPEIRLWNKRQELLQVVHASSAGTHCLSWNPSGHRLAVGGIDGTILMIELKHAGIGFS